MLKKIISLAAASSINSCSTARDSTSLQLSSQENRGKLLSYQSNQTGFDTNTYFYDSGKEVIVFDTQFTGQLAKDFMAYIRSKTTNPISHVVITHPNPDKFNGASVFQEQGAKVIASALTKNAMPGVHAYKKVFFVSAGMFTEESYPALVSVDEVFETQHDLVLKTGEKISLLELGNPGVSSNQTVALIPGINALIVGDLVHHKAHAWLEGGIVAAKATPTLTSWKATLANLPKITGQDSTLVYGGRGQTGTMAEVIPAQISYLEKAEVIVEKYLVGLGNKTSELSDPKLSQAHLASLTKKFEEAFPERNLSYLIQYGAYGLVFQKLAQ